MVFRLVHVDFDNGDPIQEVVLRGSAAVIGRGPAARVCLPDPQISRRHCEIYPLNGRLVVRDLRSANGTFVNGVRVAEALLLPGDRLTLGATRFRIRYECGATDVADDPAQAEC
jgi:pSer/pThr/pTyr-binding forkhead associated (FHA) protein